MSRTLLLLLLLLLLCSISSTRPVTCLRALRAGQVACQILVGSGISQRSGGLGPAFSQRSIRLLS